MRGKVDTLQIPCAIAELPWSGPFEGWAHNFLKKHFWRVEPIMEYADAVQECALVFFQIRKFYAERGKVDNPKWFMRLFQTSLRNHFNTVSVRAATKRVYETVSEDFAALANSMAGDLSDLTDKLSTYLPERKQSLPIREPIFRFDKEDCEMESIYNELTKTLGFTAPPSPDEIILKIAEADADTWNKLSTEAQSWYNACAAANNNGEKLPDCPGYDPASAPRPTDGQEPIAAAENGAVKAKAVKPAKAPKPAKAAAAKKVGGGRGDDRADQILELIHRQGKDATVESIQKTLKGRGVKVVDSTVSFYLRVVERYKNVVARIEGAGTSAQEPEAPVEQPPTQ